MMKRRRFVAGLASGLLADPHPAVAQPSTRVFRLGILGLDTASTGTDSVAPIRGRLGELGYVEGRNLVIESRSAGGQAERLPALAAELADLNPDVIVTITTPAAIAARKATDRIPIVLAGSADPVDVGLVTSLARPGGNVTGVTNSPGYADFHVKQLQLLKEAAPNFARIAVLMTDFAVEVRSFEVMREAGPRLGITPLRFPVGSSTDIDLVALTKMHPDSLYVFPNPINNGRHSKAILAYAAANRLPAMYGARELVEAGGLMSYWTDWPSLRRHAADYVDKIFRGAKPADLPVEDPTKFELAINLKTAKALALTIPQSLLLRADEVIQ
jgi:putative tryptophan/tyrosine transport system substrate-binding protein